jgi:riboflavin biosynthesis pyrimidine reductase
MRPYILCHMVSSVDGRIWGSRWRPRANVVPNLFETLHDRLVEERGGAQGRVSWLCGRVTAQEFARGKGRTYPPTTEIFPREDWFATTEAKAWGIFLDPHGKACWERADIGGDPILVILSEQVPDSYLAGLRRDGVSYMFGGRTEIDLARVCETLASVLGIRTLMIEGGGGANGAFLRAGLLDELSLVITAALDGSSGAPTVFNSGDADLGPAPLTRMELVSHQVLEHSALWLRYRLEAGKD